MEREYDHQRNRETGRHVAGAALVATAPLDRAADVATAAMEAGADSLEGPEAGYPEASIGVLLSEAVRAAGINAVAMATAAGRRLGRVVSITDPRALPREEYAVAMAAGDARGDSRFTVIARPRRVSAAVAVVFELVD